MHYYSRWEMVRLAIVACLNNVHMSHLLLLLLFITLVFMYVHCRYTQPVQEVR